MTFARRASYRAVLGGMVTTAAPLDADAKSHDPRLSGIRGNAGHALPHIDSVTMDFVGRARPIHRVDICANQRHRRVIRATAPARPRCFNVITGVIGDGGYIKRTAKSISGKQPHRSVMAGIARTSRTSVCSPTCRRARTSPRHRPRITRPAWFSALGVGPVRRREATEPKPSPKRCWRFFRLCAGRATSDRASMPTATSAALNARALATDPGVLLLDDTRRGHNRTEKRCRFIALIRRIRGSGLTIGVGIEPDMNRVWVSSRITGSTRHGHRRGHADVCAVPTGP